MKTLNIVDIIIKEILIPAEKKDGEYQIQVVYQLQTDVDHIVTGPGQRRTVTTKDFTAGEKTRIEKTLETMKEKLKEIEGI